jgi:hypothetical protein
MSLATTPTDPTRHVQAVLGTVLASLHDDPDVPAATRQADRDRLTAALTDLAPQDALEAMLAAQIVLMFHGALDTVRRIAEPGLPREEVDKLRKFGMTMSKTGMQMMRMMQQRRRQAARDAAAEAPADPPPARAPTPTPAPTPTKARPTPAASPPAALPAAALAGLPPMIAMDPSFPPLPTDQVLELSAALLAASRAGGSSYKEVLMASVANGVDGVRTLKPRRGGA